jgi:hypothetical protein
MTLTGAVAMFAETLKDLHHSAGEFPEVEAICHTLMYF